MKRLMFALAGAAALIVTASADPVVSPWFTTGIKDYTTWPATETSGEWKNTEGGELQGEEGAKTISLDADAETPLQFEVTNGKTIGEKVASVIVKSEIAFTPFAEAALASMEVPSDAKGGVIVVKAAEGGALSYYVLAKDPAATETPANKWTATGIPATADEPVLVTITVSAGKIVYKFGEMDETDPYDIVMSGEIKTANYTGCGTIASLAGDQIAAKFDLNFGDTLPTGVASVTVTVDEETLTPVSGNKYEIANGKTAVVTFAPATGYLLDKTGIQVTPTADITYTAEDFPVAANEILAYIDETPYTNLQEAADAVAEGKTIKIAVDKNLADTLFFCNKTGVTLDLDSHTLSYDGGSYALAIFGGSVTITNGVYQKTSTTSVVNVGKVAEDGNFKTTIYHGTAYAGSLTIAAGMTIKGNSGSNIVKVSNGASVIVEGGTMMSTSETPQNAIKVVGAKTTAEIKSGYFKGPLVEEDGGEITIKAESAKAADSTFVADYTAMLDNKTLYKMEKDAQDESVWKIVDKPQGPSPAPGNDSKIDSVPGEDNTYQVTAGETGVVALSGVNPGDTLVINSTNVNTIAAENGFDGVTIRITGRNGTVINNAAFVGLVNEGKTFSVALDPAATVTIEDKEIPVQPTIGDGKTTAEPFVVGENVSASVAAIPGLTYSLVRAGSLATDAAKETVASETATGTSVTLTDASEEKPAAAFYVIEVSK